MLSRSGCGRRDICNMSIFFYGKFFINFVFSIDLMKTLYAHITNVPMPTACHFRGLEVNP